MLPGFMGTVAPLQAAGKNYRSPESVDGATTVTAAQVRALQEAGTAIVDVRNPRLYARRHIPGAYHLDLKHTYNEESLAAVVARDEPVVIYCSGIKCSRSTTASRKAVSWGYEKVYFFRGGIVEWRNAGYPLETGTP
jgi:rhodanese-related sulfurtransferase